MARLTGAERTVLGGRHVLMSRLSKDEKMSAAMSLLEAGFLSVRHVGRTGVDHLFIECAVTDAGRAALEAEKEG
jgi:hypothetical protein